MEVLFCHDGPLKKDENNDYYGIAHNNSTFQRYYNIADELKIVIRVSKIKSNEANEKQSKITVTPFSVIECQNISSVKGQFLNKSKVKKKITEAVKKSDYIVVRLPSLLGFTAFDIAKKYNKPCLVEVVACPWDAYWNHSFKGKIIAPYMYYSMRKRVFKSNYTVYVTNTFLQKRYPTKGNSTSCSNVALTEFDGNILKNRLKKIESKHKNDKIIIGTTAAVNVKYKGQENVIKALGELRKEGFINYEYQLVGDGDETYLKSIARKYNVLEQVKFLGPMQHKNVFKWLETIDIYAQPSKQEGLPRALIEAMSRGIPAIGANTAGIPELLHSQFIFSKSKRNSKEICEILKSFNDSIMLEQAEVNYEESKKYDKDIIERKRNEFFVMFKESLVNEKWSKGR